MRYNVISLVFLFLFLKCTEPERRVPVIGFLDAFEDETIALAKQGFYDVLKENGFNEDSGTVKILYRNAQGDIPALTQACDFFISEKTDLIASNSTLATITAVQRNKSIPVCMMVAPRPDLANLTGKDGNAPPHLFGVYETLEYIDTSVSLIKIILPAVERIGTVFNQSEPNSTGALERVKMQCEKMGIELVFLPVNNSSETQLVVQSLVEKDIDAFFALPDNTIFSSFEVVKKVCDDANIPVFTSEAGLVKRGAVAAFGADMYQWGRQAGEEAVKYLRDKKLSERKPVIVKIRRRVYNLAESSKFGARFDTSFTAVK
jgi:putative ABC transport system substrate-binding protein